MMPTISTLLVTFSSVATVSCLAYRNGVTYHHGRAAVGQLRPKIHQSRLFGELSDTNKKELAQYNWGNQEDFPSSPLEEVYPAELADEEVIELMRQQRILNNDRWQTTLFRDSQGGQWTGKPVSISIAFFMEQFMKTTTPKAYYT
jgi:hypothetical protein